MCPETERNRRSVRARREEHMNVATDLIERAHEEIRACMVAFGRKAHRSRAMELCALAERHAAMEDELLHPLLADVDAEQARGDRDDHDSQRELIDQIRHASDREELRTLMGEISAVLDRHVDTEEQQVLPAMEDALGVSRMNELGIAMLDWQHELARQQRDNEEHLDELLEMTRAELYEKAQEVDLDGRSTMKKAELAAALAGA